MYVNKVFSGSFNIEYLDYQSSFKHLDRLKFTSDTEVEEFPYFIY